MALIFAGSTDLLASNHTSRFLEPLLRWLIPGIDARTIGTLQFVVRKFGHAFEYGVLALLTWHALQPPDAPSDPPVWSPRSAGLAWTLATSYALTDEFHQSFVPSRDGHLRDVVIDALGAASALLMLWIWIQWRGRIHRQRTLP